MAGPTDKTLIKTGSGQLALADLLLSASGGAALGQTSNADFAANEFFRTIGDDDRRCGWRRACEGYAWRSRCRRE